MALSDSINLRQIVSDFRFANEGPPVLNDLRIDNFKMFAQWSNRGKGHTKRNIQLRYSKLQQNIRVDVSFYVTINITISGTNYSCSSIRI